MTVFHIVTLLLVLTALFSYINEKLLKMQPMIGLMLLAIGFALTLEILDYFELSLLRSHFSKMLIHIDFSALVLQGILCFLLFAGGLNVPLKTLENKKAPIITLALVVTLLTVFFVGGISWLLFNFLGIPIPFLYTLLLGAIVAPTDPIAALAVLEGVGLPKSLEVIIDGESQFNDGVGVVIFVTLLSLIAGESTATFSTTVFLFLKQIFGGVALGALLSCITHYALRGVHDNACQLLITLAVVTATYALAETIDVSGPIASVVLGIIVGNISLHKSVTPKAKEQIKIFWKMINTLLVSVLFVLIGLEVLMVHMTKPSFWILPFSTILIVLLARFVSITLSWKLFDFEDQFNPIYRLKLTAFLTWVGLKGALGIALAMSLPPGEYRSLFIVMTYAVVVFSILIQASTISTLFSIKDIQEMVTKK